jgi:hypothetical protein
VERRRLGEEKKRRTDRLSLVLRQGGLAEFQSHPWPGKDRGGAGAGSGTLSEQRSHPPAAKRILVLCTGNSARSQMATAFLKSFNQQKLDVYTAGAQPAARINPHAIAAMKEVAIDISGGVPEERSPVYQPGL